MQTVGASLTVGWEIHDNWTEILAGTHYVLEGSLSQATKKIPLVHLARIVLITSHQMVEVMFFNTVQRFLKENASALKGQVLQEIKDGFRRQIGIKEAMSKWPEMIVGRAFDRSREPFSSQERLRTLRNETIHWPAMASVARLADAAYYTAIVASQSIYSHFYDWDASSYKGFTDAYPPRVKMHLVKAIQELKKGL